jgi:hypothetical protein
MTALAAPPTRYTRSGEARIAFQVIGDGPPDVVVVGGRASHLDLHWEDPETARVRRRYASFARAIFFNRRGTVWAFKRGPTRLGGVDPAYAMAFLALSAPTAAGTARLPLATSAGIASRSGSCCVGFYV